MDLLAGASTFRAEGCRGDQRRPRTWGHGVMGARKGTARGGRPVGEGYTVGGSKSLAGRARHAGLSSEKRVKNVSRETFPRARRRSHPCLVPSVGKFGGAKQPAEWCALG